MNESADIRWEQRFSNFNKAVAKLTQVVSGLKLNVDDDDLALDDDQLSDALTDLEKEGLIQRFEYTHEFAWNVMKDYLTYQGVQNIGASRDATREAFKIGLISNGERWMDMIKSRNLSSHTYNESTAEEIFIKIVREYYPLFLSFQQKMESLRSSMQADLFSVEL